MLGDLFDPKDLKELGRQCRHHNVPPIFLRFYTGVDSKHPVGELANRLVAQAASLLSHMSSDDVDLVLSELQDVLRWMVESRDSTLDRGAFLEALAHQALVTSLQSQYFSLGDVIRAGRGDGELFDVYPELRDRVDDEGLFVLDDTFKPMDIGLLYKDHILHYHQFLRRGFSSSPNFDFLDRFVQYYAESRGSNRFRIALDARRLMPQDLYRRVAEMDTWYGPMFNRDRLDDPAAIGVTIVRRPIPSSWLVDDLHRTEFSWSYREPVKTLEIEEISNPDAVHDGYHIHRYVHAERDIRRQLLTHFDGAAKVYLSDSYARRFEAHIPQEPRSHRKIKLFRIDGDLDVDWWMELVAHFFKGNEMVIEYFDKAKYDQVFGDLIRRYRESASRPDA